MNKMLDTFRLDNRVAVITGGSGRLGVQHAEAIAEAGGIPILWDLDEEGAQREAARIREHYHVPCTGMGIDITNKDAIANGVALVRARYARIHILINNAANDPKPQRGAAGEWSRFEQFAEGIWEKDLAVGLKGAFLCSQCIGTHLAEENGGVILNMSSDLGLIAPNQSLYRREGLAEADQPVKPVTYSVVKHGLIGLTRYLATYWADRNVRVNAICPGGIFDGQSDDFVARLTKLIPLGRMARRDEYRATVLFLVSDASSYMTGSVVSVDGGRTCW